jgi:hypothetical protein
MFILLTILGVMILCLLLAGLLPLIFSGYGRFENEHRSFNARFGWLPLVTVSIAYGDTGRWATLSIAGFKRTLGKRNDAAPSGQSATADAPGPPLPDSHPKTNGTTYAKAESAGAQERATAATKESSGTGAAPSEMNDADTPPRSRITGFIEQITRNRWFRLAGNGVLRGKIIGWTKNFIARILRSVTVSKVEIRVQAGLDNFDETGRVAGYLAAAQHALQIGLRKPWLLRFEPVFNRDGFEADAAVECRTSLIRLAWPLVMALLTFPYLSAWYGWRAASRNPAEATTT